MSKFAQEIEEIETQAKKYRGYIEHQSKVREGQEFLQRQQEHHIEETDNVIYAATEALIQQNRLVEFRMDDEGVSLSFRLKQSKPNISKEEK